MDWLNILFAVGGYIAGLFSKYFADLLTDWRRRLEAQSKVKNQMATILKAMPALIQGMKEDLAGDPHVRKIVVLPHMGNHFTSDQPVFRYYTKEHDNLMGKTLWPTVPRPPPVSSS
jgi:hypothetical protein